MSRIIGYRKKIAQDLNDENKAKRDITVKDFNDDNEANRDTIAQDFMDGEESVINTQTSAVKL